MKKLIYGLLVVILIAGTVAPAVAGSFARREARQQTRIHQGVRSGKISPCEYRRLEREQAVIENHRRKAWADGRLTPWEDWRLTREMNHASRHIWWSKHNGY